MHTAGTAAEIPAIFFFVFMLVSGLGSQLLLFIFAIIFSCTGYAWQHKEIDAEYEHDYFHPAKINKNYSVPENIITTRLQPSLHFIQLLIHQLHHGEVQLQPVLFSFGPVVFLAQQPVGQGISFHGLLFVVKTADPVLLQLIFLL